MTNWFGNSALSELSNWARTFTVPVVVSIWLSTRRHLAGRQLFDVGAIESRDLERGAGVELRHDVGQIVLGNREDHRDRLQLGDDGDAGRARVCT